MKNEDKITKITIRVEHECHGRTAYIEHDVPSMADLFSNLALRREIDRRIGMMIEEHDPARKMQ